MQCLSETLSPVTELSFEGPVTSLLIVGHFLFVAYDAVAPGLTALTAGFIKGYFLAASPPQEFFCRSPGLPYAHKNEIIALDAAVLGDDSTPPVLFSASLDGA